MKRKPIAVAVSEGPPAPQIGGFGQPQGPPTLVIVAVCDDGTIWRSSGSAWMKMPDIPQN